MEQPWPYENVTKLEAAERQLNGAIRMFFERRDMIAVHALAASAQDVLRQLGRPHGIKGLYDHIRSDKAKEFRNALREGQNFFKHAAKQDPDEKLQFRPDLTQFILFDAAWLHSELIGFTPESLTFYVWFLAKFPEFYAGKDPDYKRAIRVIRRAGIDDFEAQLVAIDEVSRLPKVNTTST